MNNLPARSLPKADAIVVLGCARSARLRRRVECGVRLYRQGAAPMLVLSGGGNGPGPEAEIMRRLAAGRGVPQAALLIEACSRDTLGNARETALLLRANGLRSVLLVSDRTHLPRAALLFRLAGLEISGWTGIRQSSPWRELAAVISELAALPTNLVQACRRPPVQR